MRDINRECNILLIILSVILISSCKKGEIPTLTTSEIIYITLTEAVGGGNIVREGTGSVSDRGVCWSTNSSPTINDSKTSDGDGDGSFTSNISGLTAGTVYYVRAYATNSEGTGYGNEMSFSTAGAIDIEGNVYKSVIIGNQVWMAENLKVTTFKDGTDIPVIADPDIWVIIETPAFCWLYNTPGLYKDTYGALYNWYTVNSGLLCPDGWHVPSDAEWTILSDYLGGENIAGGKLKEAGTLHWVNPNEGATNESGFTALPGGYRDAEPETPSNTRAHYRDDTFIGCWWSSTPEIINTNWDISVVAGVSTLDSSLWKHGGFVKNGYSVRCLKDD